MKRLFTLFLILMLVLSFSFAQGAAEDAKNAGKADVSVEATEEAKEDKLVYAYVPSSWEYPCVWAWENATGKGAFASWPGEMMARDFNNEGWWYIYLPADMDTVIINANDGSMVIRYLWWVTSSHDLHKWEVETSHTEVNHVFEVFHISEASGFGFDEADFRVKSLQDCIGFL